MLLHILETGVPIVAFLLMVAVGLDVTRADLNRLRRNWPAVAIATLTQIVLLPAAGLALSPLAARSIAEYVLLVAACPGGGMSNVYVYLARANTALSVTLTAASCVAAVVTMPLVFALYGVLTARPPEFLLPIPTLVAQLFLMTVIPVTLGAWLRDRYPTIEKKHGDTLRASSAAGVVFIVIIGLIQSAGTFDRDLLRGGLVAALLAAVGMVAGWLLGALMRVSASDRFTLLVEFAVRNLAIAMVIEVTLLHHPEFIPFGALALLAQASLLGAAVRWYRTTTAE